MTRTDPAALEDKIDRLAAETLALRAILSHILAELGAIANPDIAAAIQRGLAEAERALSARESGETARLTPAGLATALSAVQSVRKTALGSATPSDGLREEPAAFHAESNDRWPEDDY